MSTLRVDRIEPYLSSSVSIEGAIQANAATTGSNTFVGDQNILGTITASIAEGFALVGGVGNISTLVATSSFGGGSGAGFPFSGSAVITGSLLVTGSTTLIGNLNITPALAPETPPAGFQRFLIPILSGSTNTIAVDAGGSIYWTPTPNSLAISSSAGNSIISPNQIAITNGSGNTSGLFPTYLRNQPTLGKFIGVSGDPSLTGFDGLSSITNPAIFVSSGSVDPEFGSPQYYAPIQFQSSQSFSDGRVTVTTPLIGLQGAEFTGSVLVSGNVKQTFNAPVNNTQVDIAAVNGANIDGTAYTNVFFGMQDYSDFGDPYKDSFIFDYWTDFNFATGSDFVVNPKRIGGTMALTGSVPGASRLGISQLRDLGGKTFLNQYANLINIGSFAGATTDLIHIGHNALPELRISSLNNQITGSTIISGSNGLQVTGSVGISSVLQLASLDPLPAGAEGQLANSGSNLFFFSGSAWKQIAFV